MNIEMPVNITKEAVNKVKEIMAAKKIPLDYSLRVGIKGGMAGCGSAVNYVLGFDHSHTEDKIFDLDTFKVVINKKHFLYLSGITIDWVSEQGEAGFKFIKN